MGVGKEESAFILYHIFLILILVKYTLFKLRRMDRY